MWMLPYYSPVAAAVSVFFFHRQAEASLTPLPPAHPALVPSPESKLVYFMPVRQLPPLVRTAREHDQMRRARYVPHSQLTRAVI